MTEIYGNKFPSSYGEAPNDSWAVGLHDMTGEDLGKGIATCLRVSATRVRHGEADWPPTLAEFRSFCKPVRCAAHRISPQLPPPPNDPNSPAAKEAMTTIRQLLRIRSRSLRPVGWQWRIGAAMAKRAA